MCVFSGRQFPSLPFPSLTPPPPPLCLAFVAVAGVVLLLLPCRAVPCRAQEFVETDAEKVAAAVGAMGKTAPAKKSKKKRGAGSSADEASRVPCLVCFATFAWWLIRWTRYTVSSKVFPVNETRWLASGKQEETGFSRLCSIRIRYLVEVFA